MDKFNDEWFNNFDDMAHEIEVHIITIDGTQHLRLNGYLKQNLILTKAETILNSKKENIFGRFMIYPTHNQLEELKKENRKNDLYSELEIISSDNGRWDLNTTDTESFNLNNIHKLDEGIKNFLFDINLNAPEDLTRWVEKANKISLELFKKSKSYIDEYVETNDLSNNDKIKDIELMIEHFEEQEQYEDCALLMQIKEKIQKKKLLLKIQGNE